MNELQTLANYGVGAPAISPAFNTGCVAGCNVLTCSCTRTFYWSSTTVASSPSRAWTVGFGQISGFTKQADSRYVRAVRGGS